MAKIGDLAVELSADIGQFREGMSQGSSSAKSFEDPVNSASNKVSDFVKSIVAMAAVREAVRFLEDAANASRQKAEQLEKFQSTAGLSSTAAATFAASAQLAGVDSDIVSKAMLKLGMVIAQHPQKFKELGIAIRDVNTGALLPQNEILKNTVDGLAKYKEGTDRTAAAAYLAGRGAEAFLVPLAKLREQLGAKEWAENEIAERFDGRKEFKRLAEAERLTPSAPWEAPTNRN